MDVLEAIRDRRSIRRYQRKDVPDEKLMRVLEAGRWALQLTTPSRGSSS